MLTRAVRIINVSIAVLAALIAFVIYWLAFRPLPKVSGEMSAPVAAPAVVKRDARGIPHIEASSWQDAIFLQGYVTAQDRLWQMDSIRRFGAGELSAVFGPATLAVDERARRMRMRKIADLDLQNLPENERAVLVEYARGVNYFIDTHRGNYSFEFSLPGHSYDPQPWSMSDSILVGLVMFRNLTDSADADYERGLVAQEKNFDLARFHTLFPSTSGQYVSPGSNAWAVSGAHAADGKPMLANDPHLEYSVPSTWFLIHMKAPGLNVSGATLPGVPSVISGHNDRIAWGVTNLQTDALDLYAEQLDPKTGRYQFKGATEQAKLDRETIDVKGGKPLVTDIWITRHGPIVAENANKFYAMRWSAADGFGFPFMAINQAANFEQFRKALSTFWGPTQNFVYADKQGNIGYQAAGRVPVRSNFDGDFPVDGASGNFEWDGYVPYEQMPNFCNPPSGIIATANQRTFPDDFPVHITGSFADKYRINQIRTLLSVKAKLTGEDMLAVQKDVYSAYDHFLAKQIISVNENFASKNDLASDAVDQLRKWNGQMDKDLAAPVIAEFVSDQMALRLTKMVSPTYIRFPRPQTMEQMLRTHPANWVPQDNWDKWLAECFDAALTVARGRLGTPVSKWRWGQVLQWKFSHPVGNQLPLVNALFNIGPVEMSGSPTTVKQTTPKLGPSERMVVDFGDLDKSMQNLTVGESGFVASGHYKDEWPAYYAGTSFPMEFDHVDARETLTVKPLAK